MQTTLERATEPVTAEGVRGVREAPMGFLEPGRTSLVGSTVRITGQIFCEQDLFVEGQVDGGIELPGHTLTIGKQANVTATIKAHSVVVLGIAQGDIEASERIELRSSCKLEGDIRTPRLAIQDGAYFKGTIDVTREGLPAAAMSPR